jgi:hypothetical protein
MECGYDIQIPPPPPGGQRSSGDKIAISTKMSSELFITMYLRDPQPQTQLFQNLPFSFSVLI